MACNYQNACKQFTVNRGGKKLSSLIILAYKKLKQFFCSFSNVNFILGWQVFMKSLNDTTWVSDSKRTKISSA